VRGVVERVGGSLDDEQAGALAEFGLLIHLAGRVALEDGRNEEGHDLLRRAVAEQPANPRFHEDRVESLLLDDRTDQAHEALAEALENIDPPSEQLLALRELFAG
jgi:Flp pilus assembly protein TadD